MQGTIRTWKADRGYGWIRVQSGKDYFFHIQHWEDSVPPTAGMMVQFEVGPGHNNHREQAVNAKQVTPENIGADALKVGV